jgi:hypothetical protein
MKQLDCWLPGDRDAQPGTNEMRLLYLRAMTHKQMEMNRLYDQKSRLNDSIENMKEKALLELRSVGRPDKMSPAQLEGVNVLLLKQQHHFVKTLEMRMKMELMTDKTRRGQAQKLRGQKIKMGVVMEHIRIVVKKVKWIYYAEEKLKKEKDRLLKEIEKLKKENGELKEIMRRRLGN